jgi:hypothetical protein
VPKSCPQCTTLQESLDLCGLAGIQNSKTANVKNPNLLKHISIYERFKRLGSLNEGSFIKTDKPQYEVDILLAIPYVKGGYGI